MSTENDIENNNHPAPTLSEEKPGPKGDELREQDPQRPEQPELHQDELPKDVSFEDADRLPRNDANHLDVGAHPVFIPDGIEKPYVDAAAEPTENQQTSASDGEPLVKTTSIKQTPDHFETYEEGHETAVDRPLMSTDHEQQDGRIDAARLNPEQPLPEDPNSGGLGSGSSSATGNPEGDFKNDKAATLHQGLRDGSDKTPDSEQDVVHGDLRSEPPTVVDPNAPAHHARVNKVNAGGVR